LDAAAPRDTYHCDARADNSANIEIEQPLLVIFGTATPSHFYQSMSHDELSNGLLGRMLVMDVTSPEVRVPLSHMATASHDVPDHIITQAEYWANYRTGTGNLDEENPEPTVIPYTTDAMQMLDAYGDEIHAEKAQQQDESAHAAILNRAEEHCLRLALIHACSTQSNYCDEAAARWAITFSRWHTAKLRYAADNHVAISEHHQEQMRVLRAIDRVARQSKSGWAREHSVVASTRLRKRDFNEVVETLLMSREIEREQYQGQRGPAAWRYRRTS
jgi:hypothetical protein